MDQIYLKMFELAKPYYEKGRSYDIPQIEWMLKHAEPIASKVGANERSLFPLIVLHDVGYSAVDQKNPHIKDKESKKIHMREGAKIAQKILEQVDYDVKLSKKIVYYTSVHDNWALGDDKPYQECIEMALFNDLDFCYAQANFWAFKKHAESMGITVEQMYDFWLNDEKLTRRPFCCEDTKEIFEKNMAELKKEIFGKEK